MMMRQVLSACPCAEDTPPEHAAAAAAQVQSRQRAIAATREDEGVRAENEAAVMIQSAQRAKLAKQRVERAGPLAVRDHTVGQCRLTLSKPCSNCLELSA
jgi:hypothetical protein